MRIVFFGASELGYDCCENLIISEHSIVGIFTIEQEFNISYSPDKPVKNYLFKDFKELGRKYNIPVYVVNGNLNNYFNELENLRPEFILAVGWYYMIPKKMLALAEKGGAGIHGSLLPKYRGNAPLVWALINGETETGVSFFYFADGVDEGDIIAQEKFIIEENDTISEVLDKLKFASIKVLNINIPLIENGNAPRFTQDHSNATIFPKRSPEDGEINWNWGSIQIKNFIRAQTKPYPGAFTFIKNKKVIIWDADIIDI